MRTQGIRWRGLGLAIAGLGCYLSVTAARAAEGESSERAIRRYAVPEEVRSAESFDAAASAGLFVGVRHFKDRRFDEVPYAVDDAIDLAYLFSLELRLITAPKLVLALRGEPQKPESVRRLQELLAAGAARRSAELTHIYEHLENQRAAAGYDGLFVVAMATHGFSDQGDYLVASDSRRRRIERTGISVEILLEEVSEAESRRRLVLLDACRERLSALGSRSASRMPMSAGFAEAIAQASGQAVFLATTAGGFAYDDAERQNGVFTAAILDGLRGQADADERSLITVQTLSDYVHQQVLTWVKKHRPEHVGISQGITRRIEGQAASMPLAVDAEGIAAGRDYLRRRDAALVRLRENIGGTITGAMYDEVKAIFEQAAAPRPELAALIEEIEALDGSPRSQRNLAYYLEERRVALWNGAPPAEYRPDRPPEPLPPSMAHQPQAGEPWTEPGIGMRFRYIPAGGGETGRSFWLADTEVTQNAWSRLIGENPSHFKDCGATCPVEMVTWFEALAFANALSERAGLEVCYRLEDCTGRPGEGMECRSVTFRGPACAGYRLPTDSEWQTAALAGAAGAAAMAPTDLEATAWTAGNSEATYPGAGACPLRRQQMRGARCGTHPVANKGPNAWQLHDMIGNVSEWTWSAAGPQADGAVFSPGVSRLRRGCSWYSERCSLFERDQDPPSSRSYHIGFRLARSVVAEP